MNIYPMDLLSASLFFYFLFFIFFSSTASEGPSNPPVGVSLYAYIATVVLGGYQITGHRCSEGLHPRRDLSAVWK